MRVPLGTAVLVVGGFAVLVGSQVVQLANNLPSYQYNIREKIRSVQSAAPNDPCTANRRNSRHAETQPTSPARRRLP